MAPITTCPACNYTRHPEDSGIVPDWQCPQCGRSYIKSVRGLELHGSCGAPPIEHAGVMSNGRSAVNKVKRLNLFQWLFFQTVILIVSMICAYVGYQTADIELQRNDGGRVSGQITNSHFLGLYKKTYHIDDLKEARWDRLARAARWKDSKVSVLIFSTAQSVPPFPVFRYTQSSLYTSMNIEHAVNFFIKDRNRDHYERRFYDHNYTLWIGVALFALLILNVIGKLRRPANSTEIDPAKAYKSYMYFMLIVIQGMLLIAYFSFDSGATLFMPLVILPISAAYIIVWTMNKLKRLPAKKGNRGETEIARTMVAVTIFMVLLGGFDAWLFMNKSKNAYAEVIRNNTACMSILTPDNIESASVRRWENRYLEPVPIRENEFNALSALLGKMKPKEFYGTEKSLRHTKRIEIDAGRFGIFIVVLLSGDSLNGQVIANFHQSSEVVKPVYYEATDLWNWLDSLQADESGKGT